MSTVKFYEILQIFLLWKIIISSSTNHHKSAVNNQKLNNTSYLAQNNLTIIWRTYLSSYQEVSQNILPKLDTVTPQDNLCLKQDDELELKRIIYKLVFYLNLNQNFLRPWVIHAFCWKLVDAHKELL